MPLTRAAALGPRGGRSCALCRRLLGWPASESGRLRHVLTGPQGPAKEGAPAAPPPEVVHVDYPRTRFVAEFMGRTNLIDGVAVSANTVARGPLRLSVAAADLTPGTAVAVSIRPHQIELASRASAHPPAAPETNVLTGIVVRASYLGDGVDYQVQLEGSDVVLRVAGPTQPRVRIGESVSVSVAIGACVPLP